MFPNVHNRCYNSFPPLRMSDAGDEIQVDAPVEVEVEAKEAPKGKLSVEEALQVCVYFPTQYIPSSI